MKLQAGPPDRGLRLDIFLARRLETLTRSQIQFLNRSGAIRIDGRQDKAGYRLRGGETIELDFRPLERLPVSPQQIPLQIYFEDQDLAVIEKPAGVVVHPGSAGIRPFVRRWQRAGPGGVRRIPSTKSWSIIAVLPCWS